MVPQSDEATVGEAPQNGDRPEMPAPVASEPANVATDPAATADASADNAGGEQPADAGGEQPATPTSADAAAAGGENTAPTKKKRRRRRGKKDGDTAPPSARGSDQDEAGSAAAEAGDSSPSKKKRRPPRKSSPPNRERIAFHVGEEVFGKVTSVTEHAIMVDLSGKALAIFDRGELAADDLVPDVGDRFVAHVHGDGSRGGFVVLTRKPLREEDTKPKVEEAHKNGAPVMGLITGTVKGGIEVDIDGLRAFAPGSHVDLRPGADLAYLVGQRLEFKVAEYAKRGRDVVVSRKAYIEIEARELRKAALAKLEPGSIVKGVVRSVVAYGAFISIPSADDVEGLVHVTEASHDRGAKLHDIFKVGAEIDVKILRVDEKGKLWLSHKATIADPWEEAFKSYAPGTRHKGRIARLLPFGVFVELAPGVDGLIHISDLTHKRIEHPNEVVKEGDEIEVVVADLDRGSHKIALHPAPPPGEENEPRQKVAPHKAVKVVVVGVESFGLLVRAIGSTGRQGRGFIPAGQTGTERGTDLRKHFPLGTKLDAKVLEIDPRRGEAKMSLRAFKEDSEKAAYNEYRASVAKASKFGTLGDLLAKRK
jgi:small subunit ribosomal protein S1